MTLLAIDVGAGTQDILMYEDGGSLEGSTKMVLPSQTVIVAGRIDQARLRGKNIYLKGPIMGGGPSSASIARHINAGLKVFATSTAASTINDNLKRVAEMGVIIQDQAPEDAEAIATGDIDIPSIRKALALFELSLPPEVAVAVQDHGFSPNRSNRQARIEHLAEAIESGGRIENFAYRDPPPIMTRMAAARDYLREQRLQSIFMDTGPAALFGSALDPHFIDPALIINFGNGHTIAAIISDGRIDALFEHHTGELTLEKLKCFIIKLCSGHLTNSEIFEDGGHGAFIDDTPKKPESFLVTDHRRDAFLRSGALEGAVAAAPGGDMMITGCLGLVEAWSKKEILWR